MAATRVLLIGRKTMCLEGLAAILTASPEIEIVGRSAEWKEALSRVATLEPDIVIVDMVHCEECGPATPVECVSALEDTKVIIVGLPDAGPGIIDAIIAAFSAPGALVSVRVAKR